MAASQLVDTLRADAKVFHRLAICKERSHKLLEEFSLPSGLLPLENIEEVGFNRFLRFFWLKQKKKNEHKFKSIGSTVIYDVLVTGFIEVRRIRKLTGVKSKALLILVPVSEIFIEDPSYENISFATPLGFSRSYPTLAFELEDKNGAAQNSKN